MRFFCANLASCFSVKTIDYKINHTTIPFKKERTEIRNRTLNSLIINDENIKKISFLCSKKIYSSMKINIKTYSLRKQAS